MRTMINFLMPLMNCIKKHKSWPLQIVSLKESSTNMMKKSQNCKRNYLIWKMKSSPREGQGWFLCNPSSTTISFPNKCENYMILISKNEHFLKTLSMFTMDKENLDAILTQQKYMLIELDLATPLTKRKNRIRTSFTLSKHLALHS